MITSNQLRQADATLFVRRIPTPPFVVRQGNSCFRVLAGPQDGGLGQSCARTESDMFVARLWDGEFRSVGHVYEDVYADMDGYKVDRLDGLVFLCVYLHGDMSEGMLEQDLEGPHMNMC